MCVLATGCGRVGYDPIGDGDGDDVDALPDIGPGQGCAPDGDTQCNALANTVSPSGGGGASGNSSGRANLLQGSCGGAGAAEHRVVFTAVSDARIRFTAVASFDTVLYALEDDCDGAELACEDIPGASGETIELALSGGQSVLVVADGRNACGFVSIDWMGLGTP